MSEEWDGTFLLFGLPEKYEPLIMGIEGSAGMVVTSDSAKSKLLQDTDCDESNEGVSCEQGSSKQENKIRCFGFNQCGHISRDCPKKKTDKMC